MTETLTGAETLPREFQLATRAEGFHSSPVREVFDVSMQPGMISLAGGNPDLSVLPLPTISALAAGLLNDHGSEALQYGSGAGRDELRNLVVEVMAAEGNPAHAQDVQITAGSQMALELVTKLICDPGDVILAEGPSYVGALGVFEGLQLRVEHVQMDSGGLVPEHLLTTIKRLKAAGAKVKALYTVPNFHNPSGVTMELARRAAVVQACREAGIVIIEDNPYGLLSFSGHYLPSLQQLDPQNVCYLGSFSKIFSPGLRVGWAVLPAQMRRKVQSAAETSTICASVFSQMLVEEYLQKTDWQSTVRSAVRLYQRRRDTLLSALATELPAGVSWTVPEGGFFSWLTLPAELDGEAVLHRAITKKVVFVPGTAFYADGQGADRLRLAFSFENEDNLVEGAKRLGAAMQS